MKEILEQHEGVVEIVFSVALLSGLIYAIYSGDKVATGTILGVVGGYLKGRGTP